MDYHRNERQTLAKHNFSEDKSVRLACQAMLDKLLDGMTFRLVENSCDY
jgi:ferredoxin